MSNFNFRVFSCVLIQVCFLAFAGADTELQFKTVSRTKAPKPVLKKILEIEAEVKEMTDKPQPVETSIVWIDLNDDKREEFCVSLSSIYFGNAGAGIDCYQETKKGEFKKILSASSVAPEYLLMSDKLTKGYRDLQLGGPGVAPEPWWRWNGRQYDAQSSKPVTK